jgi:hypothetical protein
VICACGLFGRAHSPLTVQTSPDTIHTHMSRVKTVKYSQFNINDDRTLCRANFVDIYRVPIEIWCHIFEEYGVKYTLPPLLPLIWRFTKRSSAINTLVISHVCRYFRQITLAMPSWWSAIDLTRPMAEIKTLLERSSPLPITITDVEFSSFHPSRLAATYLAIQKRVTAVDSPVTITDLKNIQAYRNLKRIMIKGPIQGFWVGKGPGEQRLKPFLDCFQSLQSFWWHHSESHWMNDHHIAQNNLISSNKRYSITSLHISANFPETTLLSILRSCPLLENATLRAFSHRKGVMESEGTVSLVRLRNFCIQFTGSDRWFDKLQFPPSLESYQFDYSHLHPLPSVQDRKIWTESLVVGRHRDPDFIPRWLTAEPGILRRLTLMSWLMKDYNACLDYLRVLQTDKSSRAPCPALEEIHIEHYISLVEAPESSDSGFYPCLDLVSKISSSRVKAGRPALLFTWNGVKVELPKER